MTEIESFGDVSISLRDDFVATVEIHRPPNNFFDKALIESLCEAFELLDQDLRCRVTVLCSEGKNFCAGANFASKERGVEDSSGRHLYDEAVRLFSTRKPVVAVIQGAAIGGGLGLALWSDFRIASAEARFSANFARLGFHHGFGLSETLPRLIGIQRSMDLLYTGRRIGGKEAYSMGLCDQLVPLVDIRQGAYEFAAEIAGSAPLAVESIRETLRGDLSSAIRVATTRERAEQDRLQKTQDWKEGVVAMKERRRPNFIRG